MNGDLSRQSGFSIMFLKREPEYPDDFNGKEIGIRDDFNGVGVFLYQSKRKYPGKWVSKNNILSYIYSS